MDAFDAPNACCLRPVEPNELRIVDDTSDPAVSKAYIYNRERGTCIPELPIDQHPGLWPQLVVMLDSGAIGKAGASFARNHLNLNIHLVLDVIHRLVRDVRLATEHACSGDIHRALLHMCYVWSLTNKPFNSGAWFHEIQEMLSHYMRTHTSRSKDFRVIATLFLADLQRDPAYKESWRSFRLDSDEDFETLFLFMVDLPGFTTKLEPTMIMRCNIV